jgi:hypothetical protein
MILAMGIGSLAACLGFCPIGLGFLLNEVGRLGQRQLQLSDGPLKHGDLRHGVAG